MEIAIAVTGSRYITPFAYAQAPDGEPVPYARLNFYTSGTLTRADTYSDQALAIPNTNPVVADAYGRFPDIYLSPTATYAVVLTYPPQGSNPAVTIWTADPVSNLYYGPASSGSTATLTASEAIAGGKFVNIYADSGAKVRKANATDDTKPCDGYAPAAIANGAAGTVQGPGTKIGGLSGLTPGDDVWLDTTGGGWTQTVLSGAGNLVQKLGKAVSATEIFFNPQPGITL